MGSFKSFVPDYDGYDILCTTPEVCELLEKTGASMAKKANELANPERGDTPYYATDAKQDKQTHKAIVFISNTDNHGYWDNAKNGTLNKVRTGGNV